MTADPSPSFFPSLPPTFGWRRVVELADEFRVSSADMLAICDRLGVEANDASQWLDAATVDRIRDVVSVKGPGAVLDPEKPAQPEETRQAPKPPRAKAEKAAKPPKRTRGKVPMPSKGPKLQLVRVPATSAPDALAPAVGSVSRDGVRLRRVLATAALIAGLSVGIGVLVERWVESVTNTDGPATVVTTGH